MIIKAHFILYVSDQKISTDFYTSVLLIVPVLNVPGMTEFAIGNATLGLMPEDGIVHLLGNRITHPSLAGNTPRSEVYLMVDNPADYHSRSISAGSKELSPLAPRDWGHTAAYSQDPDGHILAFASELSRLID